MLVHVNLIPLNPVPGTGLQATPREQVRAFAAAVKRHGVPCTVRIERGQDIAAACGQLKVAARAEQPPAQPQPRRSSIRTPRPRWPSPSPPTTYKCRRVFRPGLRHQRRYGAGRAAGRRAAAGRARSRAGPAERGGLPAGSRPRRATRPDAAPASRCCLDDAPQPERHLQRHRRHPGRQHPGPGGARAGAGRLPPPGRGRGACPRHHARRRSTSTKSARSI